MRMIAAPRIPRIAAPGAVNAGPRDPRPGFWPRLAQMEQGKKADARASLSRFVALAPSRYDRQTGMAGNRLAQLQ